MPYRHRPMSEILAPSADAAAPSPTAPAADTPAPTPEAPALPEKYLGKTVEQVIEMHQNAESRLGQIQNELGNMRGLVSDLSSLQRTAVPTPTEVQEPVDVTGDDLLNNPVETIRRVVKQDFDSIAAQRTADAQTTLVGAETRALLTDYSDMDKVVATPEFAEFANRTPSRSADFQVAATGEGLDQVRAARRLLEDYSDFQKAAVVPDTKAEPTPIEKARAVANQGSTTGAPVSGKDQIFESDVIKLINSDPAKYRSPSFQAELMAAIKEKRYVKAS